MCDSSASVPVSADAGHKHVASAAWHSGAPRTPVWTPDRRNDHLGPGSESSDRAGSYALEFGVATPASLPSVCPGHESLTSPKTMDAEVSAAVRMGT